jgi:hypothetical protein
MILQSILLGALFSMTTSMTTTLTPPGPAQTVPFDSGRWQWNATESRVEDHLGRKSLFLKGGTAFVTDARFANGSIEFDVAFSGERGFMGGVWRAQDDKNYEEFYLRPHQSGNPDATQYTPVFHGIEGWQLYHGPRYTVPITHRFNEWTHVKILFAGARAEVYVRDMEKPVLFVDGLKRGSEPGGVGVTVGDFAPAHFSSFSFQAMESPPIQGKAGVLDPVPPGTISSWRVSDVFPEGSLEGRDSLGAEEVAARQWTRLETERSGLANLARLQGIERRQNTVFARKVVVADRDRIKQLDFGFSDRVRVYLNGRLLFRGNDAARSRDYRFLGSIGYWDTLYLPLRKGENEILLAVTEEAGGWGIQAKLPDLAGIALQD